MPGLRGLPRGAPAANGNGWACGGWATSSEEAAPLETPEQRPPTRATMRGQSLPAVPDTRHGLSRTLFPGRTSPSRAALARGCRPSRRGARRVGPCRGSSRTRRPSRRGARAPTSPTARSARRRSRRRRSRPGRRPSARAGKLRAVWKRRGVLRHAVVSAAPGHGVELPRLPGPASPDENSTSASTAPAGSGSRKNSDFMYGRPPRPPGRLDLARPGSSSASRSACARAARKRGARRRPTRTRRAAPRSRSRRRSSSQTGGPTGRRRPRRRR